jgi:hypothetical protein
VHWVTDKLELPHQPCVAVATTAKWGAIDLDHPFGLLFVDEAWQMAWKEFMLLGQVSNRFVLIGDPGQIPPVITIPTARWETAPRPPHLPAPEIILERFRSQALELELPASRRLPHDSVSLVRSFYDFDFGAFAGPGERAILAGQGARDPFDRALGLLREVSVVAVTVPTPDAGPPLERDEDVADVAARVAARVLERNTRFHQDGSVRTLEPRHIGLAATHRVMNTELNARLPGNLRGRLRVDTPERWQGLECPVMIVVHPLSGVTRPSAFDLETGRLCVMASRHRGGLIVVTRDHLADTLDDLIPSAEQAVGRPDVVGRGHAQHRLFWERLQSGGRVVAA